MEQVLLSLPPSTALVYLDDILVPGSNFQQQLINLRDVFHRLRQACLKLSPEKCQLLHRKVRYLGHIVSADGIATDPEKNKAWPVPQMPQKKRVSWDSAHTIDDLFPPQM